MSSSTSNVSRRHFLRAAATACVAAGAHSSLSAAEKKAAPPAAKFRNPFTYRFSIGDAEAWSISDGHMLFREGLNLMWPDTDRAAN